MKSFRCYTNSEGVRWSASEVLPVRHGFLTRLGGVSEGIYASLNLRCASEDAPERVRENYRRVRAAFGAEKLVFSHQIHETTVRLVTGADVREPYAPAAWDADGLITTEPGLALVIFTADCVPILLCDPVEGIVAAVHAGWRGTAGDICGRAVEAFAHLGSRPENLRAAIGPSIDYAHFETGPEVREAILRELTEDSAWVRPSEREGHFYVNLSEVNRRLLARRGVGKIALSPDSTFTRPELYWSHRYTNGRRGVQGNVIVNALL
ncbi:MAG: peptidoglycan editing factor PgeF [bacterium]